MNSQRDAGRRVKEDWSNRQAVVGGACCHGLPIRWTGETSSAPVMVLLVPNLYKLVTSSLEQPIHDGCAQPFA